MSNVPSILCKCDKSSLFPRCNKNPQYCTKINNQEYSPKMSKEDHDAIWATQICYAKAKAISFEE